MSIILILKTMVIEGQHFVTFNNTQWRVALKFCLRAAKRTFLARSALCAGTTIFCMPQDRFITDVRLHGGSFNTIDRSSSFTHRNIDLHCVSCYITATHA